MGDDAADAVLLAVLDAYRPMDEHEATDVIELRAAAVAGDVWSRSRPLHVTGSALIADGDGRLLLRWHRALGRWLQVGGHAEGGERDPWVTARREAEEETGLTDLVAHPALGTGPVQIVTVAVPARPGEGAHRHADVRYLLLTGEPGAARAEDDDSPLRWVTVDEAADQVAEDNLRSLIERVRPHLRPT